MLSNRYSCPLCIIVQTSTANPSFLQPRRNPRLTRLSDLCPSIQFPAVLQGYLPAPFLRDFDPPYRVEVSFSQTSSTGIVLMPSIERTSATTTILNARHESLEDAAILQASFAVLAILPMTVEYPGAFGAAASQTTR